MNKKAAAFQKYLEEKNITCFTMEEIAGDKLNTVVFRSHIDVAGGRLPVAIILDSSIYGMIRVRIANCVMNEKNEISLLKYFNERNRKYKIFKYYFAEDGSIVLDCYVLNNSGQADGDMIYTILNVLVKHITAEYNSIMSRIWA